MAEEEASRPVAKKEPPLYRQRKGWVPRSVEDFGDGGAFPEIHVHVAQYPLNMEKKKKISAAQPVRAAEKQAPGQYIRYTPSQVFNSAKQRVICMVEVQKDPTDTPRFKTNNKILRRPPSPPVLHSPPRKLQVTTRTVIIEWHFSMHWHLYVSHFESMLFLNTSTW